jgi:lysophospholipid acyltransferase (LPLAT)-like uncharacterized protein
MKFRKIRQDFLRFIGNYFIFNLINVLCKTVRITFVNKNILDTLENEGNKYVLAFWHGTMLLPWYIHRKKDFVALISKSKDGDILAKILKNWGYRVLRGSSSTGGKVALQIMIDFAKNNSSIAITPDGPRGPKNKMKPGAVITAKKGKLPLILAGVGCKRKKILKSWDKFEVPWFFTKAKVIYSQPIYLDINLNYAETSGMIKFCETKLNELQNEAGMY